MDHKISIDYLRAEIDRFRGALPSKAELDVKNNIYSSTDDIVYHLKSGPFSISVDDVIFECFYHSNEGDKVSFPIKNLYVMYTHARGSEDLPFNATLFPRWSYYPMIESMDSAVLCIDDPMIKEYETAELKLGWFYGTKEKSYLMLSLEIVSAVCTRLHITYENVIFWGGSSGGYAGIYAASMLRGAKAVAISPQIYIQKWMHAKIFEEITGIDLDEKDLFYRNDLVSLIKDNPSKYVIIFNARSEFDCNHQLAPFCNDMGIFPHYGIVIKDNVLLWIYDAKGAPYPHSSFENKSLFLGIDSITKKFFVGGDYEKLQNDVLFINRYWEEYYEVKEMLYRLETLRNRQSEYTEGFIVHLMSLARIDVVLTGKENKLSISLSDKEALVTSPSWLQKNGVGYVIRSYKKYIKIVLEAVGNGNLEIKLKGPYVLNTDGTTKNLPYWIDYTSFKVDDVEHLKEVCVVWHDRPWRFRKKVLGNSKLNVDISWRPHVVEGEFKL